MNELSETKKWLIVAGLSMGPAMANGFARFAYALLLPLCVQISDGPVRKLDGLILRMGSAI
jgi:hypothetical protein